MKQVLLFNLVLFCMCECQESLGLGRYFSNIQNHNLYNTDQRNNENVDEYYNSGSSAPTRSQKDARIPIFQQYLKEVTPSASSRQNIVQKQYEIPDEQPVTNYEESQESLQKNLLAFRDVILAHQKALAARQQHKQQPQQQQQQTEEEQIDAYAKLQQERQQQRIQQSNAVERKYPPRVKFQAAKNKQIYARFRQVPVQIKEEEVGQFYRQNAAVDNENEQRYKEVNNRARVEISDEEVIRRFKEIVARYQQGQQLGGVDGRQQARYVSHEESKEEGPYQETRVRSGQIPMAASVSYYSSKIPLRQVVYNV